MNDHHFFFAVRREPERSGEVDQDQPQSAGGLQTLGRVRQKLDGRADLQLLCPQDSPVIISIIRKQDNLNKKIFSR